MTTIPQNNELLNHLIELLKAHRHLFRQERVFQRVALLVIAEIVVFARHTITQLLMGVGLTDGDWSSWYRLFSHGRFPYDAASAVFFEETLAHVTPEEVYVVAGDGTQTRRSSRKMEGAHWLHNPQSPVFKRGIHIAQRWFNGSWLLPAENGYSRAVPLRKGAARRPLFLIIVRGKGNKRTRRRPLPFLVNAIQDDSGKWCLPLPVDQLLFWAWQRWEIEVAHRELKSNFGLGNKQCWQPQAAILSVQWSA